MQKKACKTAYVWYRKVIIRPICQKKAMIEFYRQGFRSFEWFVITKYGNSLSISCFLAWVPSKSVQTKKFKHELHLAISFKVQNLCSAQLSKFLAVRQFDPVLNGSVLVLFSSEKNLSVRFSVLKKWGENWTELNFSNTRHCCWWCQRWQWRCRWRCRCCWR